MRRRKRLLFFFPVFTYVCFFAWNNYSARHLVLRIAAHLLPILLLGPWLSHLIRQRRGFVRSQLDLPILAWLGVAAAASFAGLCPRLSFERVCLHVTYALGFYALAEMQSQGQQSIVFQALFLTGAVVCLTGWLEWVAWYLGLSFLPGTTMAWPAIGGWKMLIPPVVHRINATLGGATPLAAFLAILIPPAIGWILTTKRQQTRWGLGLWLAAAVPVEVLTFSRGGILALLVSLSLLSLGWMGTQPRWRRALVQRFQGQDRWISWAGLAALLAIAVLAGTFWIRHSFAGRRGSTAHRFLLWDVALDTFRAHPVLGVGPANFGRALLLRNESSLPRQQIQTAHNAYLNVAAEMGLSGLLTGAWLLSAVVRGWVANWRDAPRDRRLRMTACGAALVGLGGQLLVDTFTAAANWLPLLILTAFVVGSAQPRKPAQVPRSQPWWPVVALSILLLSTAWLGWKDAARYHSERSAQLMQRGNFEEANQEARRAQEIDAGLALYTFQSAHNQVLWVAGNEESPLVDQAIASYRTGLAMEPVWGKQTANLATVLWQEGLRSEALAWLERTVRADRRSVYLLNLGFFYEQTGATQEAWEHYGRALANNPAWAGSGFWSADPTRTEAWPMILGQAEHVVRQESGDGELTDFRARVALARAAYDRAELLARSIVETYPDSPEGYIGLARSLLGQRRSAEALLAARQAVQVAPQDSVALGLRGCARWQANRDVEAIRDLQRALFISPGTGDAHACLGQIYEEQGKPASAIESYSHALKGDVIPQDVEMTLYDQPVTFRPLPGLVKVSMGEHTAAPWLRAAALYEQMDRCEDAQTVYRALLAKDEYLEAARRRLEALPCYVAGQ